ncbi:MAG: peptidoglycan DD-metalloendopeptidase family protein [Alteromonadaceae bacterium]|nr:peptidoglycan DD-metalloendopeptidase family protein [Alteromonadaceae bacterium]
MVTKTLKTLPKPHRISIVVLTVFVLILITSSIFSADASKHTTSSLLEPGIAYPVNLQVTSQQLHPALIHSDITEVTVRPGDNLAKIFQRLNLSASDTYYVSNAKGKGVEQLLKMRPGDTLQLEFDPRGKINVIRYPISNQETLVINRQTDSDYTSIIETQEVEARLFFAQGTITSSFWHAGVKAGLSDNKIMELADIFGWDIDFAMEIRSGDTFNVAYEQLFINGEWIDEGNIVAAEFVNQGESFIAVRHSDGSYYSDSGRSMKKSFLRAPVNFRYVSSNFNPKRFHPVQKRIKPHRGVDYVAPVGTPIVSAGKGRVVEAGYNRFNGNYVFIQHGDRYMTKYLHLHTKKVKKGQSVKQGQTIGTLGRTGMVTGAHLHYEFLVDGVHRNPRTVKLPKAAPIDESQKAEFFDYAEQQIARLANNKRIMLASL